MQGGAQALWTFLYTGQLGRPDTVMVFVGGVGHFVLLIACVAEFRQLRPGKKEWRQLLTGGVLTLAFFGVIVATMLPC
jgi:hypothetical protein